MTKYKIYAGLSGRFSGANYIDTEEYDTKAEADEVAYEYACEEYDDYAGFHGLRDIHNIMEEDSVTEEEALEIYEEERDDWLDYYVEEVKE